MVLFKVYPISKTYNALDRNLYINGNRRFMDLWNVNNGYDELDIDIHTKFRDFDFHEWVFDPVIIGGTK